MSEVIMYGLDPKKKKSPLFWALVFVAVTALAAGAGFALRAYQSDNQKKQPQTQELSPLQEDIAISQDKALAGEFQGAHETLQKALQKPGLSTEDRYQLLYQQGVTYENEKKYEQALAGYQEAAKVTETQNLYASMAMVAEQLGNKEQAIDYYKKAIQLIAPDNPVGEADREAYTQKILELGGQL